MTICSSVNFKVSIKRIFNWSKKYKGPPKNTIFPSSGRPWARLPIVWLTTAWKIESAISALETPSFNKAWTSVLAKTPQREAIV